MKKISYLVKGLIFMSFLYSCQSSQNESSTGNENAMTSEEVSNQASLNYYGEKINTENAINTSEFLDVMKSNDSVNVKLSAEILATCKAKGCWMDVALADASVMKVTFEDYGFFVPTEGVEGKETIIEGYAKAVETDIETLKHYAMDAGKSQEEIDQITEPKKEIAFVATGVIIKENTVD